MAAWNVNVADGLTVQLEVSEMLNALFEGISWNFEWTQLAVFDWTKKVDQFEIRLKKTSLVYLEERYCFWHP